MDYMQILDEAHTITREFFSEKKDHFERALSVLSNSLRNGGKVLIFGNGGSAAQAQHFAAELVNSFLKPRRALPAVALTTDGSVLTSIANDFAYDQIFRRQIEALGKEGDVALALTTSGRSPSVVLALEIAKSMNIATVVLTGSEGKDLSGSVDVLLDVPSFSTPRIQEVHLLVLHLFAQTLEERLT